MWQWMKDTGKNINTCSCCKSEDEEDEDPNANQHKPRHSPSGQVIPNGPNLYIVPQTTTANAFSTPSTFNPPPPLSSDRVFRPGGGGSSPTVGAGAIPDQGLLLMEALSQLSKKDPSEYTRRVVETPEEKVGKKSKSHVTPGLFIVNGSNTDIPVAEKREPIPTHSTNNVTPYNPPIDTMPQGPPSWVTDPIRMGSHSVLRTNTPHNGYDAVNPINLHFGDISTRFSNQSSAMWDPHAGTPSVTPQYQDPNLAYSVGNMNIYGINPRDMAAEITLIDNNTPSPHPDDRY